LIATILIAYALAQFVTVPTTVIPVQIIGVFIPLQINLNTVVAIAVAGMTATGMDWLLRDHPKLEGRSTLPHWLLPALTAWILHVALSALPISLTWWAAFGVGGLFLLLVLIAEYIAIDPEDVRRPIAAAGLNALAYAQFLVLAVALKSVGLRLVMVLPALGLAAGLMSLRVIQLRAEKPWAVPQALASLVVVAQLTAALHYFPISPTGFGLVLLGALYALNNFILNLEQGFSTRQAILEPLIALLVLWGLALGYG
jgi:hypothetical protein